MDLVSLRELCTQIEQNKTSLTRQLASLTLSHDQLGQQVTDLQTERDVVKQQVIVSLCVITCHRMCHYMSLRVICVTVVCVIMCHYVSLGYSGAW